jgi:hypothetical protein
MKSIIIDGIFTSNGFFAMIFLALALTLFLDARKNSTKSSGIDKKTYILSLISFLSGMAMLVIYILQIAKTL